MEENTTEEAPVASKDDYPCKCSQSTCPNCDTTEKLECGHCAHCAWRGITHHGEKGDYCRTCDNHSHSQDDSLPSVWPRLFR